MQMVNPLIQMNSMSGFYSATNFDVVGTNGQIELLWMRLTQTVY